MISPRISAACLAMIIALPAAAQAEETITSEKATFRMVPIVEEGLENPWSMAELSDGSFLITEKPGRLRVLKDGRLLPEPITGTPQVDGSGQGGLLEVMPHPDHAKNGWIYLSFSHRSEKGSLTKIVRGRIRDGAWVDEQTIFEGPAEQYTSRAVHYGGRIRFDGAGHMYFTIGDRGDVTTPANMAQKLSMAPGKVHRLFDDGRVPEDNPFVGRPDAMPSIWSWGHRNPQGLAFDDRGHLWSTEHGPRGGDELNLVEKGRNYGWPIVSFGISYSGKTITEKTSAPGYEDPRINWTPSIAACGLAFYNGEKFPGWKGNLLAGALAHRKIVRIEVDSENKVTHQELLLEGQGRVRTILPASDGTIYVVYNSPHRIVQLVPADS